MVKLLCARIFLLCICCLKFTNHALRYSAKRRLLALRAIRHAKIHPFPFRKETKMKQGSIFCRLLCIALAMFTLLLASCNSSPSTEPAETEAETTAAEPVMVSAVRAKNSVPAGQYLSNSDLEIVEVDANTLPEGYLNL